MNGNTIETGTSRPSASQPQGWRDFCELHAAAAARELAKHYRLFARERPLQDVLPPDSFSKQFSDRFQRHFSLEVSRNAAPPPPPPPPLPLPSPLSPPAVSGLLRITSLDYREAGRPGPAALASKMGPLAPGSPPALRRELERPLRQAASAPPSPRSQGEVSPPRPAAVPPQRYSPPSALPATGQLPADVTHLSVSQIRQSVRRLLKKRPKEAPPSSLLQDTPPGTPQPATLAPTTSSSSTTSSSAPSPSPSSSSSHWLDRFASMFRVAGGRRRTEPWGCFKEGQLGYMVVEDTLSDAPPRWQRCRLLVRRGSDGYQLELFDPPKSSSSKLMARCSDVSEVRRCNRLEMPDNMNTFVLKVRHYPGSFIFETDNDQQVSSWTTEIKECINNGADMELLTMPLGDALTSTRRGSSESAGRGSPPFLRPDQAYLKGDHFLWAHPWFHGPISRVKAAHLVQTAGVDGHGVFLVRQSETRRGDYVLTFNYQGKAKHLRLSLTEWGQCRVQHLRFPSVADMLNHFCLSPIPLECGAACDVRLSSFVVAGPAPSGQSVTGPAVLVPFSLHRWSSEPSLTHCGPPTDSLAPGALPTPGQLFHRSSPPTPERPHLETLRRSESDRRPLQRHAHPHPPPLPQRDSDYELEPPARGRKRAIDNQYMFL